MQLKVKYQNAGIKLTGKIAFEMRILSDFNISLIDEMLILRVKCKKKRKKVVYSEIYKYVYDLKNNKD